MPELTIHTFLPHAINYLTQAKPPAVPGWDPIVDFTVQPLAQGEYHMNYLVKGALSTWVLRFNTGSQIGLSDQDQIAYEFKTLLLLSPLGISPTPYFYDNSLRWVPYGVLGMAFIPGESLDYQRDLACAARLFARYHQLKIPNKMNHLIKEELPLTRTYQRCSRRLQIYLDSDLADPELKSYLPEVLAWANQARHQESYYLSDPWQCLINTEVNNSNWIINRQTGKCYLTDWEKPLWGDPSQDLSHFRVPTTTLWKTDHLMTQADQDLMMQVYRDALDNPHLRDTIEERTRLRDPFNCLRAVSWCAMAWVQYQSGDHLLKNPDTLHKLSLYVNPGFVHNLFDPYLHSRN